MTPGRHRPPEPGSIEHTQSLALRLAGAAAVVTLMLGLYARSLDLIRVDVPLRTSNGRMFWLGALVVVIIFGVVVQQMSSIHAVRGRSGRRRPDHIAPAAGILPAMVVFAALQFVAWDSRIAVVAAAPVLAGAGVFTAIVVRHYLLAGDPSIFSGARLVHMVLTSGVALLSLSLAHGWMGGPWYALTVTFTITALLLAQAFDGVRAFAVRRVTYAVAGAVVVAEAAFGLSYWPPHGWYDGAFLATIFVVLMLVIEAILSHRVTSNLVIRYSGAGVGACGLLAVLAR